MKSLPEKYADEVYVRTAMIAAIKAGCQVRIDDYRKAGVRLIPLIDCRYPLCVCAALPAQIEAAIAAHQAVELARWRAEFDQTREPPGDVTDIAPDTQMGV